MPDVMADRRASPRFALILVAIPTDIESDAKLTARISDVSRTGCYVDTLNPIPIGSMVRIALARGDETFETRAKVVYVSPGLGMGIQFQDPIAPSQLAILDHWLEKATRTPY